MKNKQFLMGFRDLILPLFFGLFLGVLLGWSHCYMYFHFIETSTPSINLVEIEEEVAAETLPSVLETETPKPLRYGFTEDDIYLMAVLLTGSKDVGGDGEFDIDYGRDTEYDQISLVLCVVMNRVQSEKFPNTVSEVIWQRGQFSPMPQWRNKLPQVSDISLKRVTEWCRAYDSWDDSIQTIPKSHLYFHGDGRKNYSR